MGGVVAKGENNDELIDNLVEAKYILNSDVEALFRRVDRGDFYPGKYLEDAYKDFAMKCDELHISAPCIYCVVMENMDMRPGLSFLNIGSGTGYLSTLMGLGLGVYGTNHGLDIFQEAVDYANKKIDEFVRYSEGFDPANFCRPTLVVGNGESLDMTYRKYDRVYCGARVYDDNMRDSLKRMLTIDGILIYPNGENLVKCARVNEFKWEETYLLHVQFADLVPREDDDNTKIQISCNPHSLQQLCRYAVHKHTKEEDLDELPISKTILRYLKYYRDPNLPKPPRNKRHRTVSENENAINFEVKECM